MTCTVSSGTLNPSIPYQTADLGENAIMALCHNIVYINAHNEQKLCAGGIYSSVPSTPNFGGPMFSRFRAG